MVYLLKNNLFYMNKHDYAKNKESKAAATSSPLSCFVEVAINKELLFFTKFFPFDFGILLEWADVTEEHMPVPLLELKPWVRKVESQVIEVLQVTLPILNVQLKNYGFSLLEFERME